MPLSMWYWLCLFLVLVCGGWWGYITPAPGRWPIVGWNLLLFLLFLIIGLKTMGSPIAR